MDRKTVITIAVCITSLILLQTVVSKLFPPIKVPVGATNNPASASNQQAATAAAGGSPSNGANVATPAATTAKPVIPAFDASAPEQLLVVSNADARYTFTSRGGGLKLVELLHYPEAVSALRKKKSKTVEDVATLNESAPLPIGALLDDGAATGDGIFQLTQTAGGVRAEKSLANGLTVVKEFSPGSNYIITSSVRLENHGAQPLALPAREIAVGTATPLGSQDKGLYQMVMWYDGAKSYSPANVAYFNTNTTTLGFFSRTPKTEYRDGGSNVVWVSAQNQFFAVVAMPETPALQVVVRPVMLPRFEDVAGGTVYPGGPSPEGLQTALVYPAVELAAGQAVEQKINFFAGPKEYHTLARIGDEFTNNLELVMGFGWFGFVSKPLLLSMNWLHHSLNFSYGWAIIAITVFIKLIFWPLTAAGTRSMKRMQALQPQMNAIKEKYKDDPARMNQKTMAFMKEHKLNPVGGCLPMLIQMPVLFGFLAMVRSAIELRGSSFLWAGDLSQPDTLFIIPGLSFVPLIGIPGVGLPINLLPLIMGATQLWQSHLTPASPGMDPAQQKMMRYMPLIFLFMFYNMSAGLTLYWTVQNLLTIMQTKLTKTRPDDPLLALHPKKGK